MEIFNSHKNQILLAHFVFVVVFQKVPSAIYAQVVQYYYAK